MATPTTPERRTHRRERSAARVARLEARREDLLDAAVAAIEADGPEATMTRMAAAAGVTKPILYRYFGDRAGLYEALAARFAAGMRAELRAALGGGEAADPRRLLQAGIDAYLAYAQSHLGLYRFLQHRLPAERPGGHDPVAGFVQQLAAEVSSLVERQLRAAGADSGGSEIIGFGITGMVQLAGERWLERPTMPRRAVVSYLADTLWSGLGQLVGAREVES